MQRAREILKVLSSSKTSLRRVYLPGSNSSSLFRSASAGPKSNSVPHSISINIYTIGPLSPLIDFLGLDARRAFCIWAKATPQRTRAQHKQRRRSIFHRTGLTKKATGVVPGDSFFPPKKRLED